MEATCSSELVLNQRERGHLSQLAGELLETFCALNTSTLGHAMLRCSPGVLFVKSVLSYLVFSSSFPTPKHNQKPKYTRNKAYLHTKAKPTEQGTSQRGTEHHDKLLPQEAGRSQGSKNKEKREGSSPYSLATAVLTDFLS